MQGLSAIRAGTKPVLARLIPNRESGSGAETHDVSIEYKGNSSNNKWVTKALDA